MVGFVEELWGLLWWTGPLSFGFVEMVLFMIVVVMTLDVVHGGIDDNEDGWL